MIESPYSVVSSGTLGQMSCFFSESGELFVCGNNEYGQLGLGTINHHNVPQKLSIPGNHPVISLSCGARHTAIVTVEGKLYSFGHNDKLQLGVRSQEKVASPLYVPHHSRFIAVSCGNNHTLTLTCDFEVYSFGSNDFGQLGVGPKSNVGLNKVNFPERIISISCGNDHSIALSASGKLYTWGSNSSGQLGLSHSNNVNRPEEFNRVHDRILKVVAGYMHTAVFTEKGELFAFGFIHNDLKFGSDGKLIKSFPPQDKIISLASGSAHILALSASGAVYGYGVNGHGQLGGDIKLITHVQEITSLRGRKIVQISTGFQHSVALTSTGQVFSFGRNERGQLGIGHSKLQTTPAQVNIPGVKRIIDIFNLSQHSPLMDASLVSEEITTNINLPLPENYHPNYGLQFQQATIEETSLPFPQSFSIVGNKK